MNEMIQIEINVDADIETVWACWIKPEHIINWNFASDTWHSPNAVNDFRVGGTFSYRMESKDGSMGFDFSGKYLAIEEYKTIHILLDDNRQMNILFKNNNGKTLVIEEFEAEKENAIELQQTGWQSILNNFKAYVMSLDYSTVKTDQKVIPYLWFDTQAVEAVKWYVSLFKNSSIFEISGLSDTPSGDVETVDFQLSNLHLSAISAGPYFSFNTAISFMVSCKTGGDVDELYNQLSIGGTDLMPLDAYPFSKRYAWVQDKYGLNWQLFLTENFNEDQRIRPSLLFSADICGKAEEAMVFYASVFKHSDKKFVNFYKKDEAEDKRAKINYAEFNLEGIELVMMDHGMGGEDKFNEALSFMIRCDGQEEIDYFWERLSYVPEAEQCGWVKDKYGVSWQIVPSNMQDYFNGTEEEAARVTKAFLKMKKFDLKMLDSARKGSL